jgi:hypothetical protein
MIQISPGFMENSGRRLDHLTQKLRNISINHPEFIMILLLPLSLGVSGKVALTSCHNHRPCQENEAAFLIPLSDALHH